MKTVYFPGTSIGVEGVRVNPVVIPGASPVRNVQRAGLPSAAMIPERSSSDVSAEPDRVDAVSARSPAGRTHRNPMPFWKRAIDLGACVVALPFLALCTFAMAVMTKCVSPGPVFFRQERIGYRGRRFKIFKFRTMRVGADSSVHQNHLNDLIGTNAPMVKLDSSGDARLIPGAWLLRATGLDELPQLINVLRGEMSLVGPRPCIPNEFEHYSPWQRRRCDALPGLTGLWQVSGKNRTTFEQMIRLDIQYAREFSFWLDLKIIFLTAPCLLEQVRETRRTRRLPSNSSKSTARVASLRASTDSR